MYIYAERKGKEVSVCPAIYQPLELE